ncbi:DUF6988 family protein [Thermodesulfobacteriota bacterium]
MEKEIIELIDKGKSIKINIEKMVKRHRYPQDNKSMLFIAYHSIVAEHHTSIHLLIQSGLTGSSFALVRSLYEPIYRAHWVYGCALDDQIKKIIKGKDIFPRMKDMVEEIDDSLGTGDFWQLIKKNSWTAMNDYTHSGMRQIMNRFKGNEVIPDYELGAIVEVLSGTNIALLLMALFFFNAFNKIDEVKELQGMIVEYTSSDEDTPEE